MSGSKDNTIAAYIVLIDDIVWEYSADVPKIQPRTLLLFSQALQPQLVPPPVRIRVAIILGSIIGAWIPSCFGYRSW